MRTFHCTHCGRIVFFENTRCTGCGSALGYLPGRQAMAAFAPADDGVWLELGGEGGARYRPCHNYRVEGVCNWMLAADDPHALCVSCRLTRIIPELGRPQNKRYWYLLEAAKRRLLTQLHELGLPAPGREEDPDTGLCFEFLEQFQGAPAIRTGYQRGLITLNLAEADDVERARVRQAMHEPYRTLLGHFRHESGHFYWYRLINDGASLRAFRELFGDERADYPASLRQHYYAGPPVDWEQHYISAYAASHPWEDWAETWAHYLHMLAALRTAQTWGFALNADAPDAPADVPRIDVDGADFDTMLVGQWIPLAQFLNAMNRSLGQEDSYPFTLPPAVVDKLRLVHRVLRP